MSIPAASEITVTPGKVEAVVKRLVEVGRPKKIIIFGSYVRGNQNEGSDLDILVVTDNEKDTPHMQSARLRRAVDDILMPMDILVVPQSLFERLSEQPGLIYREACQTGKVVYERTE